MHLYISTVPASAQIYSTYLHTCTVYMYVGMYTIVHSTGASLNAGDMASGGNLLKTLVSGNLLKTLVSKEMRRYKEGGYDLDLTCIPPSSIVSVLMFFVVQLLELVGAVNGGPLGCMDPFQTIS